jgi:hypothetical protein
VSCATCACWCHTQPLGDYTLLSMQSCLVCHADGQEPSQPMHGVLRAC